VQLQKPNLMNHDHNGAGKWIVVTGAVSPGTFKMLKAIY
jgi:hypothetical protein